MSNHPSRRWRALRTFIICFFATVFLSYVSLETIFSKFTLATLTAAVAMQPLVILSGLVVGFRLVLLIGRQKSAYPTALCATVLSIGSNVMLPGRFSEFVKAGYLARKLPITFSHALAAVFLERLADALLVGLIVLVGAALLNLGVDTVVILVMLAAAGGVLAVAWRGQAALQWLVRFLPSQTIRRCSKEFLETASSLISSGVFVRVAILGVGAWLCSYLSFYVFFQLSGHPSVGLIGVLSVFIGTTIGGAIPAAPGGLGTYEAGAVLALTALGFEFNQAVGLAIVLHVSQLAMGVGGTLCILAFGNIRLGTMLSRSVSTCDADQGEESGLPETTRGKAA